MQPCLGAARNPRHTAVCVCVPGQQCRLKKQEASRPNPGRATKPGQNVFAEEKLHAEKQKRSQKNHDSKQRPWGPLRSVGMGWFLYGDSFFWRCCDGHD